MGLITVHGHSEGHIAHYADIEFELTEYHNFYEMLWQNLITDIRKKLRFSPSDNEIICKNILKGIYTKAKSCIITCCKLGDDVSVNAFPCAKDVSEVR